MKQSHRIYLRNKLAHSLEECSFLSSNEYTLFWINIIEQQSTFNIDTMRCIDVKEEKLDALFVNSNSFKT